MSATEIKDEGKVVTTQRTLGLLLGVAVAGAIAWTTVKATADDAKAKAVEVGTAQAADHDTIVKTAATLEELKSRTERIENKLDRALSGQRPEVIRLTGSR